MKRFVWYVSFCTYSDANLQFLYLFRCDLPLLLTAGKPQALSVRQVWRLVGFVITLNCFSTSQDRRFLLKRPQTPLSVVSTFFLPIFSTTALWMMAPSYLTPGNWSFRCASFGSRRRIAGIRQCSQCFPIGLMFLVFFYYVYEVFHFRCLLVVYMYVSEADME